ncbi:hypothetical protein CGCTS75_v005377 [Colletotrichum tropicale]|nr:hypothetical protein CGCTS75_v005377 [Colletotrichum tropicale]
MATRQLPQATRIATERMTKAPEVTLTTLPIMLRLNIDLWARWKRNEEAASPNCRTSVKLRKRRNSPLCLLRQRSELIQMLRQLVRMKAVAMNVSHTPRLTFYLALTSCGKDMLETRGTEIMK